MKPEEQLQSSAEGFFFLCQTAYNYWRRNPAASDSRNDKDGKVQRHLVRGDHGKNKSLPLCDITSPANYKGS